MKKGEMMKNKVMLGLLIVSLGLNIGTFSMLFYEKFMQKRVTQRIIYDDDVFEELNLSEEQEEKIDELREKWFKLNDSIINRMIVVEANLDTIDEEDFVWTDSLNDIIVALEDTHKILFEKYLSDYETILDDSQLKIFKERVNPKVKVIKIKIDEDSDNENVDIKIIKRIETDSTKEEKK